MLRVSLRVSAKHAFELRGALRAILFCRYLISKIKDALPHCESACAFLRNALLNKRLRASRVDKAHFVRSADAGSFARDYSLALPACYARDVLHSSRQKALPLYHTQPKTIHRKNMSAFVKRARKEAQASKGRHAIHKNQVIKNYKKL